ATTSTITVKPGSWVTWAASSQSLKKTQLTATTSAKTWAGPKPGGSSSTRPSTGSFGAIKSTLTTGGFGWTGKPKGRGFPKTSSTTTPCRLTLRSTKIRSTAC